MTGLLRDELVFAAGQAERAAAGQRLRPVACVAFGFGRRSRSSARNARRPGSGATRRSRGMSSPVWKTPFCCGRARSTPSVIAIRCINSGGADAAGDGAPLWEPACRVTISGKPKRNGSASGASAGVSRRARTRRGRNTMFSKCSHTRRASSMSGMSATTRWAIWSPATAAPRASTSCTRWGGTPSACRRRMRRSPAMPIRRPGPARTSRRCAASCSAWALPMTGRARSRPAIRNITATSRRCSSTSSRPASPTARNPGSIGTRSRTPCWPTSR